MNRADIKLLVLGDQDMECDLAKNTIQDMNIGSTSFKGADLERYDMVVYIGSKGAKILKSKYTPLGIITR
jgi:hypothetical protein